LLEGLHASIAWQAMLRLGQRQRQRQRQRHGTAPSAADLLSPHSSTYWLPACLPECLPATCLHILGVHGSCRQLLDALPAGVDGIYFRGQVCSSQAGGQGNQVAISPAEQCSCFWYAAPRSHLYHSAAQHKAEGCWQGAPPDCSRAASRSRWPWRAARWAGVSPRRSPSPASAPRRSSSLAAAKWPCRQACSSSSSSKQQQRGGGAFEPGKWERPLSNRHSSGSSSPPAAPVHLPAQLPVCSSPSPLPRRCPGQNALGVLQMGEQRSANRQNGLSVYVSGMPRHSK
jgi:hypothetical protein